MFTVTNIFLTNYLILSIQNKVSSDSEARIDSEIRFHQNKITYMK